MIEDPSEIFTEAYIGLPGLMLSPMPISHYAFPHGSGTSHWSPVVGTDSWRTKVGILGANFMPQKCEQREKYFSNQLG